MIKHRVATGASYGAIAKDDHARRAVKKALAKMEDCAIGSVLLFLSSAYAHSPQNAIKEAVKASGTPQVYGCCAMGLLTEEEWLLDVEGAVAMVFPRDLSLQPLRVLQQQGVAPDLVLTLSSPNASDIAINSCNLPQFGSVTTDEFGHGPFSVWQSGRIVEQEFSQMGFAADLKTEIVLAEGIEPLSPFMQINLANGSTLIEVGQQSAQENLSSHISTAAPFDVFCAVAETNNPQSIEQGHYRLLHVVSIDQEKKTVTLSEEVTAGKTLFWAKRNISAAKDSIQEALVKAQFSLRKPPEFAMMFPNVSRGPEFFGGIDMDLEAFKTAFPDTPLIGFFGNAELAPGFQAPVLTRHHAAVAVLFA